MTFAIKTFVLACVATASVSAHFAWIETEAKTLRVGQQTKVKVGFGHEVGKSESAVNLDGLELWAIAPSGQKTALKPATADKWVVADFTATEAGIYRFVMAQDRGVMSQTTKGFKLGGRDVHPNAKKSMKMWRSAVTYATAGGQKVHEVALGLPLEILAKPVGGQVELTVLRAGKPTPGVAVSLNVAGKEAAEKIGTTDSKGKFRYAASSKGPSLFLVTVAEAAPAGSNFDSNTLSAVLVIH